MRAQQSVLFTTSLRVAVIVALALSVLLAVPAVAASCRVLDAELQGDYQGGCVDGLADGQGVAVGTARYNGQFVAGRKHGAGTKTWPGGDRYEGEFANDLKHGYGVYVWGAGSQWSGQRYTGQFVSDQRQGSGVYEWPDGRQLAGQWRNDRPFMALPPAMQHTARAHAERMVVLSRPGAKVCRNVPVGIAQIDLVSGVVLTREDDRVRIRIEGVGRLSNQLDGRAIAPGTEIMDFADQWYPCR